MPPVLLVEARESLRGALRGALEAQEYAVEAAANGREALVLLENRRFLALITALDTGGFDARLLLTAVRDADPLLPVIVLTAPETSADDDGALPCEPFELLPQPVAPAQLVSWLRAALERRRLLEENLLFRGELAGRLGFPRILGESPALDEVIRQVQRLAPSDLPVLLEGEAGTGKRLLARAIHHLGPRRAAPFVAATSAEVPRELRDQEIFGLERGAAPGGANARPGCLELAERGTLFVAEVAELSARGQGQLLRVLEERAYERGGGNAPRPIHVRIIAATRVDLRRAVADGTFRDELYSHLKAGAVRVPPLRERAGDVALLAVHFLERYRRELRREAGCFSEESLAALRAYAWPGNIRELSNCVERSVMLADGERIQPRHLGLAPAADPSGDLAALREVLHARAHLDEITRRSVHLAQRIALRRALSAGDGHADRAARLLGITEAELLAALERLGIDRPAPA